MSTSHEIPPLSYPIGWPKPPSKLERVGLWIPIFGWLLSSMLERNRLRPGILAILEQLDQRPEIPDGVWPDSLRADVAKRIIYCCQEACDWPHPRFAPHDPFEILIELQIGDLCELDALMRIQKEFSLKLDDDTIQALLTMKLREVVEYVISKSGLDCPT